MDADELTAVLVGALASPVGREPLRRGTRRRAERRLDAVLDRDGYACRSCGAPVLPPRLVRGLVERGEVGEVGEIVRSVSRWRSARSAVARTVRRVTAGGSDVPVRPSWASRCRACAAGVQPGAGPHAGPPAAAGEAAPEWAGLVRAALELLDGPAHARLLVEHVLLLDGSTLNVGGTFVPAPDDTDGAPAHLTLVASRVEGGAVEAEFARVGTAATSVSAHVSLLDVLASTGSAPIDVRVVARSSGGALAPVRVVPLPGCTWTANADVMDPVPPLGGLGCRLRPNTTSGRLRIDVVRLSPSVEVTGISTGDTWLDVRVAPSPPASCTVTTVWVEPRETPGDRRVLRSTGAGSWRLDVAALDPGPGRGRWDVWAAWDVDGERHEGRVGRRRADLRLLRESVTLPWVEQHGIRVSPYYAASRHLSIRVRP